MTTINFKEPTWIITWINTALKKEQEKLSKCPVIRDMVPGHELAQAWGFVVTGYFLIEESFKALLHLQGKSVPMKHSLSMLFNLFGDEDRVLLREYYTDFRATRGSMNQFPIKTLDQFLANLDGDTNVRGTDHVGSFDWRYFLIEENRSEEMPMVSVEFLHEITYGCCRMMEWEHYRNFEPSRHTHSWRMRWKRDRKREDWLTVRMNSEGWKDLPERLELTWGPDYSDRYDLLLFKDARIRSSFAKLPDNLGLPVIDRREEFESFDPEIGLRSIGIHQLSRL